MEWRYYVQIRSLLGQNRRDEMAEIKTVLIAAVQTEIEPAAYRDDVSFSQWIDTQVSTALLHRCDGEEALVTFPELIALPLYFREHFSGHSAGVGESKKVMDAAKALLKTEFWRGCALGFRMGNITPSAFLLPRALWVFDVYTRAFAEAARAHRCTIVAGSVFLPPVEHEAARGTYIEQGGISNVSFTFSPQGRIIARTSKVNLTRGLESSLGLRRGRKELLPAPQLPFGRLATLICYDAFFETLLEHIDALGGQILVQPSANARPWDGPWSADAREIEGKAWLERGPAARIAGRSHLRVVVNPMLVGQLFDLGFEGRSSITVVDGVVPEVLSGAPISGPDQVASQVPNTVIAVSDAKTAGVAAVRLANFSGT